MAEQLKHETAEGPQGRFSVSTIRTDSGGAAASQPLGSPFSSADYADETPWPFETMVFKEGSAKGVHHRAYGSRRAALAGHGAVVEQVREGKLPLGAGVSGAWGNPDGSSWRQRRRSTPTT